MCTFLHHLFSYCIALNPIFPAFTLSSTFSNISTLLQQMEPMPSQVRNHYSHKNQKAQLDRALAFKNAAKSSLVIKCLSSNYLPICILLQITNIPDLISESGWLDWSGDRGWRKWGYRRVPHIIWHVRRRFGSSTGGPSSRSGVPGQVIKHYKDSTAKEPEPCRYRHCTPSTSNFPKSTCSNGTTTAQPPIVIPPQIIIWPWPCTIRPDTGTSQQI